MQRVSPRKNALVVRIGDRLIVFPGSPSYGPRCIAAGQKSGTRCSNSAQSGDYDGWSQWFIPGYNGSIGALEPGTTPTAAFLQQHCPTHANSTRDAVSPEWQAFDPELHRDLIHEFDSFWTPDGLRQCEREVLVLPSPEDGESHASHDPASAVLQVPEETASVPTALYFWYDADDVLLYIGITGDLAVRQTSHAKRSSWSEFADHSKIQRFPDRPQAEAAEVAAIRADKPIFNHVHNDTPEARARLVAYLIEHDRADLLAPAVQRG